MPDKRQHRGPHPEDGRWFSDTWLDALRHAVGDLSWLLSRGYASTSSLKLVGDRYRLTERQRMAVMRCAAADDAVASRQARQLAPPALQRQPMLLDGYNVLTTVEVALSGGLLLLGRDGCLRDLAQMSGTYHRVLETEAALVLVGQSLERLGIESATWYFDSPVSNSGRLASVLRACAASHGWAWTVELVFNPDPILMAATVPVATADSVILDRGHYWFNLAGDIVETHIPNARILDLARESPSHQDAETPRRER